MQDAVGEPPRNVLRFTGDGNDLQQVVHDVIVVRHASAHDLEATEFARQGDVERVGDARRIVERCGHNREFTKQGKQIRRIDDDRVAGANDNELPA